MIFFTLMNLISASFSPGIILALSFMLAAMLSMLLVPVVSKFATVNGLFDGHSTQQQVELIIKIHRGRAAVLGGVAFKTMAIATTLNWVIL